MDTENAINKHINLELYTAYIYLVMVKIHVLQAFKLYFLCLSLILIGIL